MKILQLHGMTQISQYDLEVGSRKKTAVSYDTDSVNTIRSHNLYWQMQPGGVSTPKQPRYSSSSVAKTKWQSRKLAEIFLLTGALLKVEASTVGMIRFCNCLKLTIDASEAM
jgi:hypothetical protein